MEDESKGFTYSYSAKQQEEVKRIQQKYIPREEDKMEQLRRLDRQATRPGTTVALIVGVISVLLLGLGMCCTMVWTQYFVPGIVIGVIGIIGVSANLPLYNKITERQREKIAPQIMQLSDELIR